MMGDMREVFEALSEDCKKRHTERVAKTPDRIDYAIQQFEKNGIQYKSKNPAIGHFHCWRKSDGRLYQFWAGTGKILGYRNRGIHLLLRELMKSEKHKAGKEAASYARSHYEHQDAVHGIMRADSHNL